MIYLLIAILEKFAKKILSLRGDELMTFMQRLPTKDWDETNLELVIAEAFVLKKIYGQKNWIFSIKIASDPDDLFAYFQD